MKGRSTLTLTVVWGALCVSQPTDGRPVNPSGAWAGTWRLSLAQSRFSRDAPRGETRSINVSAHGMSVRSSGIAASGKRINFSYSLTLDGRFHPLVGNPDGDSISARLINPRKMSIAVRRSGKLAATATTELSARHLVMYRHRLKLSGNQSEDVLIYDRVR